MIHFFLMLLGLAFSHNNANATTCNNNQDPVTVQNDGPNDPGTGTGDDGGPVGGNTGQLPPPFTPPNP